MPQSISSDTNIHPADRIWQLLEQQARDFEERQKAYELRQQRKEEAEEKRRKEEEKKRAQEEKKRAQEHAQEEKRRKEEEEKFRREMKALDRQRAKEFKEFEGFFVGQWGKLVESLVEGDLVRLLQHRGIAIDKTSERVKRRLGQRHFEFDILAIDGKELVLVEVKTTLKPDYVKEFVEKLGYFEEIFPEYRGYKAYGAMAYLKQEGQAAKFAYRQGLFVIRATGKSASIENDEKFIPKSFGA